MASPIIKVNEERLRPRGDVLPMQLNSTLFISPSSMQASSDLWAMAVKTGRSQSRPHDEARAVVPRRDADGGDPRPFDFAAAHARGRGKGEDGIEGCEGRRANGAVEDGRGLCCGTGSTREVEDLGEKRGRTIQGTC